MSATEREVESISSEDLSKTIEDLEKVGYRLLMIKPADSPREALLTSDDKTVRAVMTGPFATAATNSERSGEWTVGRAGMMYRDLVPDRLGGELIASHIRIVDGGPVKDRVHFHKIDFQVIYCLKGAINVVYEDQGDPFWLRAGDCVLQPPEIRHRVLEAEAGSEVVEMTAPAQHETWFDNELELPTSQVNPERSFNFQRFVRCQAATQDLVFDVQTGFESFITPIGDAGPGTPMVTTLRASEGGDRIEYSDLDGIFVRVLIDGRGIELSARIE